MNKYLFFKSIYKDYIIIFEKNNNLKTYGFDKNLIKYKNNNDINYIIIDNNFNVTFYKSTLNNYYKYYIKSLIVNINFATSCFKIISISVAFSHYLRYNLITNEVLI